MKALPRFLLPILLAAASLSGAGCYSDDDDDEEEQKPAVTAKDDDSDDEAPAPAAPVAPVAAAKTLTGTWLFKNESMPLTQTGSAVKGVTIVTGFVQNPADPVVYPVPTVGSIDASGVVRLDEKITYTLNPAKNFLVKKVGKLTDPDTLVLDVVAGQAAHTQVWKRKK